MLLRNRAWSSQLELSCPDWLENTKPAVRIASIVLLLMGSAIDLGAKKRNYGTTVSAPSLKLSLLVWSDRQREEPP